MSQQNLVQKILNKYLDPNSQPQMQNVQIPMPAPIQQYSVNPLIQGGVYQPKPFSPLNGFRDALAGFGENAQNGFNVDNLEKRIDPNAFKRSVNPDDYNTQLTPEEETAYQSWFKNNQAQGLINPNDVGNDYDFRGAFKAGYQPTEQGSHWIDTYKKPNHETFSNESQYATGQNAKYAGKWNGDNFIAPRNENVMTKIGEALGTAGRFAASPVGRGLIVGGLVGATGGSPLQMMGYGGSASLKNQQLRTSDQIYREQLKQLGYTDEQLNNIRGYIDQDTAKTVFDNQYKQNFNVLRYLNYLMNDNYKKGTLENNKEKLEDQKRRTGIYGYNADTNRINAGTKKSLGEAKIITEQKKQQQIERLLGDSNKPSSSNGKYSF